MNIKDYLSLYRKNIQICKSLVVDLIVINYFSIELRYKFEKRIFFLWAKNKWIMHPEEKLNLTY